jgi:hypothetical protein
MSGAYSHYRFHMAVQNGRGSRETVIKLCIWAFPLIWVSCNTRVRNCLLLKAYCYLVPGQYHSLLGINGLNFWAAFTSFSRSLSLRVLTCPSFCALQQVSDPSSLTSIRALTCPSLCAPQRVSAPRSLSFRDLICPSLCALQEVGAPRLLAFFPCPHLSVALRFPGSERPSLARFHSACSLVHRSALSSG